MWKTSRDPVAIILQQWLYSSVWRFSDLGDKTLTQEEPAASFFSCLSTPSLHLYQFSFTPPMCDAAGPSDTSVRLEQIVPVKLSYIATFQLKHLHQTEMTSRRHKPCHRFHPPTPITSVPLSRLLCYGAKTARDPPVLLDCGSCDMEEQLGPTNSLNSASYTNRHAHTKPFKASNLKSVHPTVNFLTASWNVFNLSDPYSRTPGCREHSKTIIMWSEMEAM